MKIMGNGINYSTGDLLFASMDEVTFAKRLQTSLGRNAEELLNLTRSSAIGTTFRSELERERTPDLGNARAAGWTFLLNQNDPRCAALIDILRPLAKHRGMSNPSAPLVFSDESPEEWFDWLLENYSSLILEKVPHYVLIVGGPDQVPFRFQSLLGSAAAVGRVDFDSLEDLRTYVEKVILFETNPDPVTSSEAICFAPDGGLNDATYFSRRYMVEPLIDYIRNNCGLETRALVSDDATKRNFAKTLLTTTPALVYAASHGLGAPDEPFEVQKRLNGAICCQRTAGFSSKDWLFTADDVPPEEPFLEGAVFFQFACFSYGTPAESDFSHWLGQPELNTTSDFIAALPKRLLAHPRGPIAFIGHVDTAWLHGFTDPNQPHILDRWHPRIEPFVRAVDLLLKLQPVGLAMAGMVKKYDIGNALLTSTFDRLQRGRIKVTPEFHARLVDAFITRNDAQNYFIFGDPAVSLRMSVN